MADGKFIAQSPGNTKVDEKKGKMQKEECCVGMIAGFQGSGFVDEKHVLILCNRGREEIRNLQFRSGCGGFCKSH